MSALTGFTGRAESGDSDSMNALWWLTLPLVAFVALLATSLLAPGFYALRIESEQGLLELSHIVIPAIACVVALRSLRLPEIGARRWLTAWFAVLALGSLYIAGEEASWGQHILAWTTPEAWQQINDQNETNLHNISSWLDQKPRLLLELAVLIGGIALPLIALARPSLRQVPLAYLMPPLLCLPSAVLAEIGRLPERVGPALGLGNGPFGRASEIQELYFYIFILLYVVVLRRRIRTGA